MLRHNSRDVFFFQNCELGNIFENFDQKSDFFCQKNHFFGIYWHFMVKIFKNVS